MSGNRGFSASEPFAADAELDNLTPREREVLQLIARGYPYKEVAARVSPSIKTVEAHVLSVLENSSSRDATSSPARHRDAASSDAPAPGLKPHERTT